MPCTMGGADHLSMMACHGVAPVARQYEAFGAARWWAARDATSTARSLVETSSWRTAQKEPTEELVRGRTVASRVCVGVRLVVCLVGCAPGARDEVMLDFSLYRGVCSRAFVRRKLTAKKSALEGARGPNKATTRTSAPSCCMRWAVNRCWLQW